LVIGVVRRAPRVQLRRIELLPFAGAILAGAVVLSVPTRAALGSPWPSLALLGACLAWALDNNLTRQVSLADGAWLAMVKGAVAGPINLALAFSLGARLPAAGNVAAALVVGFFAYGVSLVLFIVGMRHLGTARDGAYYSTAHSSERSSPSPWAIQSRGRC
jgi:drug/metabolite transporter (DMT)-like permease